MNWIPTKMALLMAALALSACGGGGSDSSTKLSFSSMVSFGDSLSDVGTYKVGAIAAVGGGKWTVNGTTTGPVNWTELLASQLNLPAPCAAQTGLQSNLSALPAVAVVDHPTCTNYAQGSARVTSVYAPNSTTLQATLGASNIGLIALPLANQFTKHLTAHGNYTGKELVTVMVGGNDVFMHLNAVAAVVDYVNAALGGTATPTEIATAKGVAQAAALVAEWSPADQATIAGGVTLATANAFTTMATTAAVTQMAIAATTQAALVQTSLLDRGAKYVLVVNLPSVANTPLGLSQSANTQALLTSMATTYNNTLQSALAGKAGVLYVDAYTQGLDQTANPAQYGLTNVTTPACRADSSNILAGSSLACTTSNTLSGVDVSSYQYADTVHPTPAGYKLLNRYIALQMAKAGWL
ncbi:Phospholipase/lecithinase/hemolysin [Rhodoferax sp. OV413]|uniref:SGNH/GDSL hydrolase family protein n=1 Tax=Rhodoferax sp. OV413 TaxID=1855285 RepID=UPI000881AA25|nr:SGNH/GDSL hydrolase family protein [Rhodoferax sp. OV413]SDO82190.1 Phospholipase/lecithinase/hemolysin [Rhodoferax sp. OV413]